MNEPQKIKVFLSSAYTSERAINEWLDKNPQIQIEQIHTAYNNANHVVTILYRERSHMM